MQVEEIKSFLLDNVGEDGAASVDLAHLSSLVNYMVMQYTLGLLVIGSF